jgi:hypothetical protein
MWERAVALPTRAAQWAAAYLLLYFLPFFFFFFLFFLFAGCVTATGATATGATATGGPHTPSVQTSPTFGHGHTPPHPLSAQPALPVHFGRHCRPPGGTQVPGSPLPFVDGLVRSQTQLLPGLQSRLVLQPVPQVKGSSFGMGMQSPVLCMFGSVGRGPPNLHVKDSGHSVESLHPVCAFTLNGFAAASTIPLNAVPRTVRREVRRVASPLTNASNLLSSI